MKTYNDIYNLSCDCEDSTLTFDVRETYGKYNYITKRNDDGKICLSISQKLATRLKLDKELFITEWIDEDILVLSTHALTDSSVKVPLKTDNRNMLCIHKVACLSDTTLKVDFSSKLSKVYHDVVFNNNRDDSMAVLTFYRVVTGDKTAPPVRADDIIIKNRSPRKIVIAKRKEIENEEL